MAIPDFSDVELGIPDPGSQGDWAEALHASTGKGADALVWETPEGIGVKPVYGAEDLSDVDFLHTYPGVAPFLRGPYPTAVRRVLHRRGVQRVLPAQPRRRPEGPFGRVRPGHPPRLRL